MSRKSFVGSGHLEQMRKNQFQNTSEEWRNWKWVSLTHFWKLALKDHHTRGFLMEVRIPEVISPGCVPTPGGGWVTPGYSLGFASAGGAVHSLLCVWAFISHGWWEFIAYLQGSVWLCQQCPEEFVMPRTASFYHVHSYKQIVWGDLKFK